MLQVFLVAFTKQMYLINQRDPGGFPEMGLMGQRQPSSAGLGRLPGHRASGSAQALPALAIPGQQAHLSISSSGAGLGPGLSPSFIPPH